MQGFVRRGFRRTKRHRIVFGGRFRNLSCGWSHGIDGIGDVFLHIADFVDGMAGRMVNRTSIDSENLVIESVAFKLHGDIDAMIVSNEGGKDEPFSSFPVFLFELEYIGDFHHDSFWLWFVTSFKRVSSLFCDEGDTFADDFLAFVSSIAPAEEQFVMVIVIIGDNIAMNNFCIAIIMKEFIEDGFDIGVICVPVLYYPGQISELVEVKLSEVSFFKGYSVAQCFGDGSNIGTFLSSADDISRGDEGCFSVEGFVSCFDFL